MRATLATLADREKEQNPIQKKGKALFTRKPKRMAGEARALAMHEALNSDLAQVKAGHSNKSQELQHSCSEMGVGTGEWVQKLPCQLVWHT